MKTRATFTNGKLTLACESTRSDDAAFSVTFEVTDVLDGMTPEDRRAFVDAVLMSEDILRGALRRLAGDTDCWRGEDHRTREEWLVAIGERHDEAIKVAEAARTRAVNEAWDLAHKTQAVANEVETHIHDVASIPQCCRRAVAALTRLMPGADRPSVPAHDAKQAPPAEVTP